MKTKTKIPTPKNIAYVNGEFKEKSFLTNTAKFLLVAGVASCAAAYVIYGSKEVISMPPISIPVQVSPDKSVEDKLKEYIQTKNTTIKATEAEKIVDATMRWADKFKVSPLLLIAVQQVESGFNKFGISSGGALGIMQTIPSWHLDKLKTATKELGSPELFDPNVNIYVGAWILKDCMKKFANNQVNYLRCYSGSNANPNGYEHKVQSSLTSIKRYLDI